MDIEKAVQDFTTAAEAKHAEVAARLLCIEQKITAPRGGSCGDGGDDGDVGFKVVNSPQFKSFLNSSATSTGRIEVGSSLSTKTAILNATGLNQPLVPPYIRPGVLIPGQQRLTVRDLLPSTPIASNMVEYARELSFTSAAAMQTAEGQLKGESAATYELKYSPVQTLAHWIPVSRQLMDDAPAMQGYLNGRLQYFLKLKEEDELLNGSGIGTNLSGLILNSTAYDTGYTTVASDTYIDVVGHAIQQVFDSSNLEADAVIVNPTDWHTITLIKTTGTASSGEYIFSDPRSAQTPQLWGVPIVRSKSMARGQFLAGAFQMGAMIWDRGSASVEISREHSDYFVRNLVAVLVEERLALTVFRPEAFVYSGFPFGS